MADDDVAQNQDASPEVAGADLPARLRVHTLARVLGTTSRRVLDTLLDIDGRSRSPQSSVDRADAVRVREALAVELNPEAPAAPETSAAPEAPTAEATPAPEVEAAPEAEPEVPEPAAEVEFDTVVAAVEAAADVFEQASEPESRTILETPFGHSEPFGHSAPVEHSEPPEPFEHSGMMPLFVAPQPVTAEPFEERVSEQERDEDDAADDEEDTSGVDVAEDESGRPASRRRRRGRRGRGRGRGEQAGGEGEERDETESSEPAAEQAPETTDTSKPAAKESEAESDADDEDGEDDEASNGEGSNRRRRRRRRRKSGAGGDEADTAAADDPPNTVVHERAPRAEKPERDSNEIQGISGSTRLEAKRQRRRDGRDAGRRRPPILTEAEFLARREAVNRVMVVRDKVRSEPPHEGARYTQIAVMEDGVVVEHFVTSAASASLVGNIYLGIVQNVLPSMEAAFVDIGRGRNGVLYAGEVNWEAAGLGGANRKIEQALKPGDCVVVQVSKDPVGHKGARLTTQVSLAGRYLVYVPGASSTGISRKLPDTERQRLKEILRDVVPDDAGVIIRTASEGVKEDEIRVDVNRLQERWAKIAEQAEATKAKASGAAVALYEEPDVLVKVIRDLFNEDFSGLIVSGQNSWDTINDYVNSVAPELVSKVTRYDSPDNPERPDVFAVHRIDEQLAKAMDRKVWLPSGGTLVIDRTEAMTVVDVNTGKFTGAGGNLEQTVTKNNLEAAEEVVRQLRLRDIGGIVVIDFIDMVLESNRDLVLRRLTEALGRDRTRHQVSEVTSLGLVQLTRKRLGTGLVEAFSTNCTHCSGRGIVLHGDPVDTNSSGARKAEPSSGGAGSNGNNGGANNSGGANNGGGNNGGGNTGGSRRSKRGRKPAVRVEEPVEAAKVASHVGNEHPMFKAMAAANGKPEDELDPESVSSEIPEEEITDEFERDEAVSAEAEAEDEVAGADYDGADEDGADDDGDEIDLDEDDALEGGALEEDGLDLDTDSAPEPEPEPEVAEPVAEPAVAGRRPRRRASARPAGPPTA